MDAGHATPAPARIPVSPRLPLAGTLATLCLAMLLSSLGTSIANVGLPAMSLAFDAPFQRVQWVVLAYLLAVTTLAVAAGRLGDLVGRRRLMLVGVALFTVASAASALAPSLWLLVAARAAQGAGAAMMMSLTLATVGDALPPDRVGRTMGLLGTTSAIGTAIGPGLGGLLLAAAGWPALFLVNVPLGLLALWLARRHLPADAPRGGDWRDFDAGGAALLAGTLAAYALAMTVGRGQAGVANLMLGVLALAGLVAFVGLQRRRSRPLVSLALFGRRTLSAAFAMNLLVTAVAMTTLVVGPFYLATALALPPAQIGLVMSAGPVVAALAGTPAGRLVDRLGAARVGRLALALAAIGAAGLACLPARWGVPAYVLPLVLFTAGFAAFQAANNTAVLAAVGAGERGVVAGLLSLSRNLGLVTGAAAMAALFAAVASQAGGAGQPAAVEVAMHATFLVATALVGLAGLVALAGQRPAPQP